MDKSNTQKIRLGLFVIISTLLLIITLYLIGNRQNILGKTFKISAVFTNVNGLQSGNNVRYSGINVGTVKTIEMINDTTICIDMVIEQKIQKHLKKNAVATIGSDGLVGSMVVNIIPDKNYSDQIAPGDTIKSYSKISTNDMLTTLNTTNENAALLTADLLKITNAVNNGKGTLGLLINDPDMASNLKQTISNLNVASYKATQTIDELNSIINAVNYEESLAAVLLSDSIAAQKMQQILNHLNTSGKEINTVVKNLNDVIITIKQSNGAYNFILTDTTFVKNLDKTMLNIKEGSVKLNENLEALKHNFLFRRYFKKLEKQQNK